MLRGHFAGRVANLEKLNLFLGLALLLLVVPARRGPGHAALGVPAQGFPKSGAALARGAFGGLDHVDLRLGSAVVAQQRQRGQRLGLFHLVALGAVPLVEVEPHVEDKNVSVVERRRGGLDLLDAHVAPTFELQQPRRVHFALDVLEARLGAALEVAHAAKLLEHGEELWRLVALRLAVLLGHATQRIVELAVVARARAHPHTHTHNTQEKDKIRHGRGGGEEKDS